MECSSGRNAPKRGDFIFLAFRLGARRIGRLDTVVDLILAPRRNDIVFRHDELLSRPDPILDPVQKLGRWNRLVDNGVRPGYHDPLHKLRRRRFDQRNGGDEGVVIPAAAPDFLDEFDEIAKSTDWSTPTNATNSILPREHGSLQGPARQCPRGAQ